MRLGPQRTCVACHNVSSKVGLVRLVRTVDGKIEVDATGKRPGRGAYLCASDQCWASAVGKGRLERAMRVRLDQETRESLLAYGSDFSKREVSA
ncbi:MAG TPA: YlxR family protein [Dehalococcoidia bacterium]|nr:YlxR family protein [Dehalococcoidia bacterium]